MGRLLLIAVILLVVGAIASAALSLASRGVGHAGQQIADARPRGALMQKTSYVLLVALVLYVALWGGA